MEFDFPEDFIFVGIDGSVLCQEKISELPSLESALKVNEAYKNTLLKLKDQLENLLYINQSSQKVLEKEINNLTAAKCDNHFLTSPFSSLEDKSDNCLQFCGIPYFKDTQLNCPPQNADAISIEKLGLTNFINCSIHPNNRTTNFCLASYTSSVKVQAQKVKLDHLVMQCGELEEQMMETGDDQGWRRMLERQLQNVENKIDNICSLSDEELFEGLDPSEFNWDRIADENLMLGTPQQLKLYWSHYLRVGVNTEPWTNEEQQKLQELVDSCGKDAVNWNQVAVQLNTKRTPFECFRRYQKCYRQMAGTKLLTIEEKSKKTTLSTIAIAKLGRPVMQSSLSVQAKKQKLSMILRPLVCNIGKKKRTHTFPGDARNQSIVLAAYYRLLRCHFDRAPKQVMPEEELEQIGIKPLDGMSFNHLIRMMATVAPPPMPLLSQVSPLPPDYFNLTGFRGLLLHRPYLEYSKGEGDTGEQHTQSEEVSRADNLLLFRMMTLFFWPVIMNSVAPTLQPEPKPVAPLPPAAKYRKMTKYQLRRLRTNILLKVHQKKKFGTNQQQPVDDEPESKKPKLVSTPRNFKPKIIPPSDRVIRDPRLSSS